MSPKIFGTAHIIYFITFLVLGVISLILIKKYVKSEKVLTIIIKSIAAALLIAVILNRISIVLKDNNPIALIPSTFCGLSSFVLSLSVLIGKRDSSIFQFICYIGPIGGAITIFYPTFISQSTSIFYFATITGLLHHTIMLYLGILLLVMGWFKPSVKKAAWLPLGLCCFVTYGTFLSYALGIKGAMDLDAPLISNSIFHWWFIGIVVIIIQWAIIFLYKFFTSRKKARPQT